MATKNTAASKKLSLSKETLRQLAPKDLKGVRGGTSLDLFPTQDCVNYFPTQDCVTAG